MFKSGKFTALRLLFMATVLLAVVMPPATAQTGAETGLRGRVSDPSGASIPGTTVTLLQAETGAERVVTTNELGDWQARFLSPGPYRVTFEITGFKKLVREGINVTTSEISTVNATLEVGAMIETVEVIAEAEMLSASSATIVHSLNQRELDMLPTSSRNFTQLLVIEPGVSADISDLLSK